MGLATSTHTVSSLPPTAVEEGLDPELLEETVEDSAADEADALDAEAQAEGYADQAERATLETDARRQGWRPLAEYRGKPGGWVSAKTFIARGKDYLPFVQKELRDTKEANTRMVTEIEGLRGEVGRMSTEMKRLLEYSRRAGQAGYDRAVKDLKQQQRDAAAAGDVTSYDKIEGQLAEMAEARAEAQGDDSEPPAADRETPAPQPTPRVEVDPSYSQWQSENPWFLRDRVLNAAMIEEHNQVLTRQPGLSIYDSLELAKEGVVAQFPKKFGVEEPAPQPSEERQRRPAAPLPPRGGPRQRPAAASDPIEALQDPRERAEARAGYAQAKKSMPDLTKEEYMDVLNNPHGDVLEVIAKAKKR